ncbi:uncharacterized protein LOC113517570 isoform X1 [Galleria mellonella]|uniref:Uncharacterized protein LOC113517570 isoform X1 n=2 Tax=Galleria mellonella TaxID=7137 RepID=A0A6J1WRX7_GALME|nr:uncharacterized protein LOC113517570 isoform X1 [Galleria mellonella]
MAFVYSCCFWFSLRLGGLLIGIYSIFQAILALIVFSIGYKHSERVADEITELLNNNNIKLIYTKDYLEMLKSDPEKYFTLTIVITCVYILSCLLFMYGAYTCNNILMIGYILLELTRLLMLSVTVATCLLVLKQNTMDIGLLIGASVAGGFFLLGEFYLWVCAANLPILINEMEREEQAETIERLQQLLEMSKQRSMPYGSDNDPFVVDYGNATSSDFMASKRQINNKIKNYARGSMPLTISYSTHK